MTLSASQCWATVVTPDHPGAVGIFHVAGNAALLLAELTGAREWKTGRISLSKIGSIEQVLLACIDDDSAMLMPHAGPRAMQRVIEELTNRGVVVRDSQSIDPEALYPEAESRWEALALGALARAASPLAIDLLLRQPHIWRATPAITAGDRDRSRRLRHLLDPPLVVLAGLPNVGKSTLTNHLAGRSISIEADLPGTTRDYTAVRIDLAGLVVNWVDTPGLRATGDDIESRAIHIARRLFDSADLIIAMADHESGWPDLPRPAGLRIANKADLGARSDGGLHVSAATGTGVREVVRAVREILVAEADLAHPGPWLFDPRM